MRTPQHEQPKVAAAHKWLSQYDHDGLLLDLYGAHDEDDVYEVLDIAVAGTNISLYRIADVDLLDTLTEWCNATRPSAAQVRRQQRAEARIDLAEWLQAA